MSLYQTPCYLPAKKAPGPSRTKLSLGARREDLQEGGGVGGERPPGAPGLAGLSWGQRAQLGWAACHAQLGSTEADFSFSELRL